MEELITVKFKQEHKNFKCPSRATSLSSGYDLYASLDEPILINPGERKLIPVGFSMQMSGVKDNNILHCEAQIRSRSGLALKHGIVVLNSPGTIDEDYSGQVGVILINFGKDVFTVKNEMRIAQMIITTIPHIETKIVDSLEKTDRGLGGFGSTGI